MSDILKFIILGIVQGFTEPLPISSSGHLIIFEHLLNIKSLDIGFSAFINFGSTIAIIIYFYDKIIELFLGGINYIILTVKKLFNNTPALQEKQKQYAQIWDYILKVIVATIPLGVVGIVVILLNFNEIENVKYIGVALLITALALFLVSNIKGKKTVSQITYTDVLIVGTFQAIAFLPGISRSGMCLVGALVIGLKAKEAFDFAFIMYIPASIGALLLSIIQIISLSTINYTGYISAFILSAIFTFLGLILLKKTVIVNKLYYFSIYCVIVGLGVILFLK